MFWGMGWSERRDVKRFGSEVLWSGKDVRVGYDGVFLSSCGAISKGMF